MQKSSPWRLLIAAISMLLMTSAGWGFVTHQKVQKSGELHIGIHVGSTNGALVRHFESLAKRLNARPVIHEYAGFDRLFNALSWGEIDLIGEPLSLNRPIEDGLSFSLPLQHSDLWLVSNAVDRSSDHVAVRFGSDAWHFALQMRNQGEEVTIKMLPADKSRSQLFNDLASGELSSTLAYANHLEAHRKAGLRPLQMVRSHLPLGWVARSEDRVLRAHVDEYLQEIALTSRLQFIDDGDWDEIQSRGRIRLVTLYRPETYFAWKGELLGFDYELAERFAKKHNLTLEVVIASDKEDLFQRLQRGEADFAAAFLHRDEINAPLVAAEPYFTTNHRLVSRSGRFNRVQPVDLHDKRVIVAKDDQAREHLVQWRDAGVGLTITDAAAGTSSRELIRQMLENKADFALVADYQAQLDSLWRDDLQLWMSLPSNEQRVWVVRNNNPELLKKINAFWQSGGHQRTLHYQLAVEKYFNPGKHYRVFREAVRAFARSGALSPYDELIQRYSNYYDFDWRLILAVIFIESQFDPQAVSSSGAKGLMQVRNLAAQQVGVSDLFDPQSGIHAGIKYLDWLRDRFDPGLTVQDRTWFSLAAYNGGLEHVKAARKLAPKLGLDPRQWDGHVEKALLELPKHDDTGRHRHFKPRTVINYVNTIRSRFESYARLTNGQPDVLAYDRPSSASTAAGE